jgi:flagellar protein FlaH
MALARWGDEAPRKLFSVVKREAASRDFLIVDSFTTAIAQDAVESHILGFFEACKRLCATGKTLLITLHTQSLNDDLIAPIRSMCDARLNLRTEKDGNRLVKTLEVAKIRGATSVTGAIVGFEVEPGWGMRVIPISKARG